jgi:hypothetical protein
LCRKKNKIDTNARIVAQQEFTVGRNNTFPNLMAACKPLGGIDFARKEIPRRIYDCR